MCLYFFLFVGPYIIYVDRLLYVYYVYVARKCRPYTHCIILHSRIFPSVSYSLPYIDSTYALMIDESLFTKNGRSPPIGRVYEVSILLWTIALGAYWNLRVLEGVQQACCSVSQDLSSQRLTPAVLCWTTYHLFKWNHVKYSTRLWSALVIHIILQNRYNILPYQLYYYNYITLWLELSLFPSIFIYPLSFSLHTLSRCCALITNTNNDTKQRSHVIDGLDNGTFLPHTSNTHRN